MCEYCGRNYKGVLSSLPLKNISSEIILNSYIRRNNDTYEIAFKYDNEENTLEISNCPMCGITLVLNKVYYVQTKEGYICEDMSKNTGKLQTNSDKNYAFPCCFESLAKCVVNENEDVVVEESLFADEYK